VTRTLIDPVLLRLMEAPARMDSGLPVWARRTHPIVRRELGIYWKTIPLELTLWAKLLLLQVVVVVVAVPFPVVYTLIVPIVTVSALLLPIAFGLYAYTLFKIVAVAAAATLKERQNDTLALLLATPMPRAHILYSKIAAAVWRNLDNLSLVMICHVLLSLPIIMLHYATLANSESPTWTTSLLISLMLVSSMIRLFLEPVMAGAVGAMMGICTSPRVVAVIAASSLLFAYFAFLNLPRLLPLAWDARLLLEIALPVLLPLVVTAAAIGVGRAVMSNE